MSVDPHRVAARYLSAATTKLTAPVRTQVNRILIQAGMDGNGRFRSPNEALTEAGKILGGAGMEWGEIINGFPLRKPSGHINVDLAMSNPDDPFSPTDIGNSMLAFQWYQLENGLYEIVAYLS